MLINRSENLECEWRLPNTLKIEIGTIENSGTQAEICNDLDFVCVNPEKPGYVFFFVSVVKINQ